LRGNPVTAKETPVKFSLSTASTDKVAPDETFEYTGTLVMMTGFERYTKKTRRAIFLEEME
jgi:hypothetical protein